MVLTCTDDDVMAAPASVSSTRTVPADVQAASELLAALASPVRLSIVALLDEHGSRCVHQLVDALGVPPPLVCRLCGRTVEVAGPTVEAWADRVAGEHGFADVSHTLEIVGTCADCRRQTAGSEEVGHLQVA